MKCIAQLTLEPMRLKGIQLPFIWHPICNFNMKIEEVINIFLKMSHFSKSKVGLHGNMCFFMFAPISNIHNRPNINQ